MALDIQRISLDISKQPTPQQVRLGQGDANATQLIVSVFDDGIAYDLTSYSVRLSMRLPNGGGYYNVNGTHSGNVATFDVDESYAASTCGFNGFGYVDILSGDTVICSTSRFQLVVLQNASDGVELAPQYSDAIQDAIDRANAAAEAAEGVILQDVPMMSANILGGAKLGDGLSIDANGVLSTTAFSGVLAIDHGGTGASSAENARTSLGITPSNIGAAASVHVHSASDITSGTLPVERGGTGATSAASAAAAIVDGQAISPSSVSATGDVSDATGTLDAVRTRANASVGLTNNSDVFFARYYVTQGGERRIYFYETVGAGNLLGYITLTT